MQSTHFTGSKSSRQKKLHVMTAKLSQQCKNTLRLENYQMHYIIKSTVQDF